MAIPRDRSALVVIGGGAVDHDRAAHLMQDGLVIAADSGLDRAYALGLTVDVAVGDFDSVSSQSLDRAGTEGVRIERHPAEKDQTDLELALGVALDAGARRIAVIGGAEGRLDHTLGNALVLASSVYASAEVDAVFGQALVHVVRDERSFGGELGELVTLLAAHGPASGVTTRGLLYALERDDLVPGSSQGISNQMVSSPASVSVESGTVLVVRPGELGPPLP